MQFREEIRGGLSVSDTSSSSKYQHGVYMDNPSYLHPPRSFDYKVFAQGHNSIQHVIIVYLQAAIAFSEKLESLNQDSMLWGGSDCKRVPIDGPNYPDSANIRYESWRSGRVF
jgi:hypothetical protein